MAYRAPDYPTLTRALRGQWAALLDAIDALSTSDFSKPTRLGDWDVAALVAHIGGNSLWLTRCASAQVATRAQRDHQSYFDRSDSEEIARTAKTRAAQRTAQELQELAHEWTAEAETLLETVDPITVVAGPTEPIRFDDLVLSRVVEGVVHGLDLAHATREFDPDPSALAVVARWLGGRLERAAPGRSVEVRVPPLTAVQCAGPDGEGPRHTRGTPPNTVEMSPATWIELATGRLDWTEAVSAHRIHASGRLADLRHVLPLLS